MKRSEIEAILNNAELDNATRLDQIMSIHGADANTWNQDRANLTKERDEARQAGNAHSDYDQIVAERDELRAYRDEREMSDRFAKVVSGAKFKNTYTEKGVMGDFVKALGDDQNKGKTDEEIFGEIVKGHEAEYFEGRHQIIMPPPSAKTPRSDLQAYLDEKYKDNPWYKS